MPPFFWVLYQMVKKWTFRIKSYIQSHKEIYHFVAAAGVIFTISFISREYNTSISQLYFGNNEKCHKKLQKLGINFGKNMLDRRSKNVIG